MKKLIVILSILTMSFHACAQIINTREFSEDVSTFSGDGSLVLHSGSSAARPLLPLEGMIRFNSELDYFETYKASGWDFIVDGSALTTASQDLQTQIDTATQDIADNTALIGTTSQGIRTDLDLKAEQSALDAATQDIADNATLIGTTSQDIRTDLDLKGEKSILDTATQDIADNTTLIGTTSQDIRTDLDLKANQIDLVIATQDIAINTSAIITTSQDLQGQIDGFSGSALAIEDESISIETEATLINFTGAGVTTTTDGGTGVVVDIPALVSGDNVTKELDNIGSDGVAGTASTYSAIPTGASSTVTITADNDGVAGDSISVTGATAGAPPPYSTETDYNATGPNSTSNASSLIAPRYISFLAKSSYDVTKAITRASNWINGATGHDVWITLRNAEQSGDHRPSGAPLATSNNVNTTTIPNGYGDVEFTFPTPHPITSGTWYSMVFQRNDNGEADEFYIANSFNGNTPDLDNDFGNCNNGSGNDLDLPTSYANNAGGNGFLEVFSGGVGGGANKSVSTLIGDWNTANSGNTATVNAGGSEEPDVGVVITLSGGVDAIGSGDTNINAPLVPDTDSSYNIGNASRSWKDIFAQTISLGPVGFYYSTSASSQACDTTCPAGDVASGYVDGSGACSSAWTSASVISTCATVATDNKCLCVGSK